MKQAILFIFFFLTSISNLFSQDTILSESSVRERQNVIQRLSPDREKIAAEDFARKKNLSIRTIYKDGTVLEIRRISTTGNPEYYKTYNLNAARTTSTDKVWEGGKSGLNLDGAGIVLGLWDAGAIRTTHQEFGNRARMIDGEPEINFHATHVAGTLGASGVNEQAHGMASKCVIDGYNWDNDISEMRTAAGLGLLISNHSYGLIQGWEYNQEKSRWEWYGDEAISETEDYNFGFYGEDARKWDEIAHDNPRYLIVNSAGNDRRDGPAPGAQHFVFSDGGWVSSTKVRDLDGGTDGYDCIGTQGTSKNILTVGAINDLPDGYQGSTGLEIASFSVFGPTDDGRIKPDIVGNGISLYSSSSDSDNSYGNSSGTSMAAPNIAGSLALLQQHYRDISGGFMNSSLLKALVLHTADDAGNEGPDYKFGWGLMNTASAAKIISEANENNFILDTLNNRDTHTITYYSTGKEQIKITAVWNDPPGNTPEAQLNPTNRILVNDLDIRLTRLIDDLVYRPFVLDPVSPSRKALQGDNIVDNVEQIHIKEPLAGYYSFSVSHKSSLTGGQQPYGLVISGLSKDYFATGTTEKNDSNGEMLLTSAGDYLNNMDVSWLINPDNDLAVTLYFDYFESQQDHDILTIYDGDNESAPVIAVLSGSLLNTDTVFQSTSGSMLVKFASDESLTAKGFRARYCTVAPEGDFTIIGDSFPCQYTNSSYFALGQEGTDYNWKSEPDWNFNFKSSNGIDLSIGDTEGVLNLFPYNRCGNGDSVYIDILTLDSPPLLTAVTGDTVPCAGVSSSLTADVSPGIVYKWELPADWLGSSELSSINFIPSKNMGTVFVSGNNACGKGNQVSVYVNVQKAPEEENIFTEHVPPCENSTQAFFVEARPGYEYSWEVRDDWEILSGEYSDSVIIKVGESPNFVFVNSANKCGDKESNRLFLTAPLPEAAHITVSKTSYGYPLLEVTNASEFAGIRWYRDESPIQGESGSTAVIIPAMNGVYLAETISEEGCMNLPSIDQGILINEEKFVFVVYRISESTIVIENTLTETVEYNIVSMLGEIYSAGVVVPGYNEVSFSGTGIFLFRFFDDRKGQVIKTFL